MKWYIFNLFMLIIMTNPKNITMPLFKTKIKNNPIILLPTKYWNW